jgi:hypothetical protein
MNEMSCRSGLASISLHVDGGAFHAGPGVFPPSSLSDPGGESPLRLYDLSRTNREIVSSPCARRSAVEAADLASQTNCAARMTGNIYFKIRDLADFCEHFG